MKYSCLTHLLPVTSYHSWSVTSFPLSCHLAPQCLMVCHFIPPLLSPCPPNASWSVTSFPVSCHLATQCLLPPTTHGLSLHSPSPVTLPPNACCLPPLMVCHFIPRLLSPCHPMPVASHHSWSVTSFPVSCHLATQCLLPPTTHGLSLHSPSPVTLPPNACCLPPLMVCHFIPPLLSPCHPMPVASHHSWSVTSFPVSCHLATQCLLPPTTHGLSFHSPSPVTLPPNACCLPPLMVCHFIPRLLSPCHPMPVASHHSWSVISFPVSCHLATQCLLPPTTHGLSFHSPSPVTLPLNACCLPPLVGHFTCQLVWCLCLLPSHTCEISVSPHSVHLCMRVPLSWLPGWYAHPLSCFAGQTFRLVTVHTPLVGPMRCGMHR